MTLLARLALFAATPIGKWIVGAAEAGLGAFVLALINGIGGLGLSTFEATTLGSILGSMAGRIGIPLPPYVPTKAPTNGA